MENIKSSTDSSLNSVFRRGLFRVYSPEATCAAEAPSTLDSRALCSLKVSQSGTPHKRLLRFTSIEKRFPFEMKRGRGALLFIHSLLSARSPPSGATGRVWSCEQIYHHGYHVYQSVFGDVKMFWIIFFLKS